MSSRDRVFGEWIAYAGMALALLLSSGGSSRGGKGGWSSRVARVQRCAVGIKILHGYVAVYGMRAEDDSAANEGPSTMSMSSCSSPRRRYADMNKPSTPETRQDRKSTRLNSSHTR